MPGRYRERGSGGSFPPSSWVNGRNRELDDIIAAIARKFGMTDDRLDDLEKPKPLSSTPPRVVTSAYQQRRGDEFIIADSTGGAFTITLLPPNEATFDETIIKRINGGGNNVTVDVSGGSNIDNAATYVLNAQWKVLRVRSNGAQYLITGVF